MIFLSYIKRGIYLGVCLWGAVICAKAQTGDTETAVQIKAISLDETITGLSYFSDNKNVILGLPPFLFSETQNYIGPKELVFFKKITVGQEGQPVRVGSVLLPSGAKRVLLLIAARPDGTCEIQALPDDPDGFQAGKARLYNATPYALAIACDGVLVQLAPGKMTFASGSQNRIVLKLAYSYSMDGNWIRAGNNVFSLRPTIRQSIFFIASRSDYFNVGAGRKSGVHMVPLEEGIPPDETKVTDGGNRAQKH